MERSYFAIVSTTKRSFRVWNDIVQKHFDAPVEQGRDFGFAKLLDSSWPFGVILRDAFESSNWDDQSEFSRVFSSHWKAYNLWLAQQDISSFLGVRISSKHGRLPAWAVAMPWSLRSPIQNFRELPSKSIRGRAAHGAIISPWRSRRKIMDSVGLESGPSHASQFWNLFQSVLARGFDNQCNRQDPLLVWVLRYEGEDFWMPHSGFHRTSLATILGIKKIHAEVQEAISIDKISSWPNVANGVFTRVEAEEIFVQLVTGVQNESHKTLMQRLGGPSTGLQTNEMGAN